MNIIIRRKKLLYQANHRGIKEADLLIGNYANVVCNELDEKELDELEILLQQPDSSLIEWITSGIIPDNIIGSELLRRMHNFHYKKIR